MEKNAVGYTCLTPRLTTLHYKESTVFQILAVGKVLVPIAKYEKKDYKISDDLVL